MPVRQIPAAPSTNIASVGYDDETRTLYIQFRNHGKGALYTYKDVPAQVAEGFSVAGMATTAYFNQNILNQYLTTRMG